MTTTTARTMPAKYETHCFLCDRAVRKGNTIRVLAGDPTVHATCHELMCEPARDYGADTDRTARTAAWQAEQAALWTAAVARVAQRVAAPVARPYAAPAARGWREGVQARADRQFAEFERSLGGGE